MEPDYLARALADGRIKTLHETGRSGGTTLPDLRAHFEKLWFGDVRTPPVYGVFTRADQLTFRPDDPLDRYGSLAVVLKPGVRERSTFVVGDSLGAVTAGDMAVIPNTVHIGNPKAWQRARLIGIAPYGEFLTLVESRYVEAQVHGGVKLDDIDHIRIAAHPGDRAYTDLMRIVGGTLQVLELGQQ